VAALPLLGLVTGAISLALSPFVNAWIRSSVEHAADRYALDLTNKPRAFVSAMEKLGRLSLSDPKPPAIVKYFLYDHPPLQERIDYGRDYEASKQASL
jgi:Zn-dependent protease with chaperone function